MYAHCLFCNADLGRNEALEAFPVGRRLAYDAEKGRLWVVCSRCARWNLTPLEERWEAIEQAERLYRGTRLRASTEHVGLARVRDATDLVRIGRPLGPEIAAWRYGPLLTRRRRRALAKRVVVELARTAVDVMFYGPVTAVARAIVTFEGLNDGRWAEQTVPSRFRVPARIGGVLLRLDVDVPAVRVRIDTRGDPTVVVPFGRESRTLVGEDAIGALAPMLVGLNTAGAPAHQVRRAVARIADAGSASAYLARLGAANARSVHGGFDNSIRNESPGVQLHRLSPLTLLAFEMALHDAQERRAMEGELAQLERAWRDAEEIAAIADSLLVPRGVQDAWEQLRRRVSS